MWMDSDGEAVSAIQRATACSKTEDRFGTASD